MLIMSLGCLQFSRESCLLYAFLLGYLPSIFFGLFLQNLLTFICRTPITINLDRKAGQPVRLSFHLVPKLQ